MGQSGPSGSPLGADYSSLHLLWELSQTGLGDASKACTVKYETKEASAKADLKFVARSGSLAEE